jgi:peptidyl-prolyl cis-trans isomerase B (cyclophilin B)
MTCGQKGTGLFPNTTAQDAMLRSMNQHARHIMKTLSLATLLITLVGCGSERGPDQTTGASDDSTKTPGPNPLSVTMVTDKGQFEIRLRPDLAPLSVMNFCNLVERGFYHGKEISASNAVARTLGETRRTPQYQVPPEFSTMLYFDKPGIVAWSNLPRSEGADFLPHPTRFFFTVKPQDQWNLQYVPFGTIESGADVAGASVKGDWIISARINGDPTWLYELHADRLAEWNTALDASGHPVAGTASTATNQMPLNSN